MYARIASVLVVLAATTTWARAEEDRTVESPEAVQAICAKAMPDLLEGRSPEALRKITSDPLVDDTAAKLRVQFTLIRDEIGSPIDSVYAGVRKQGELFRQYIFLCRYDSALIVWRFTAENRRGRWRLAACYFDSNYSALLAEATADENDNDKSADCTQIADTIVAALAHERGEAVEKMKANWLQHNIFSPEKIRYWAEQAVAAIVLAGGAVKVDKLQSRDVAGVLADRTYIAQCERGPIKLGLLLYRPGKDWKVLSFQFQPVTRVEDIFAGAPLEFDPSAAATHTAHTPAKEPADKGKSTLR